MQYNANSNPFQAFAYDNHSLTRALGWAYFNPDAGRHSALLAEDVPDVYRRVFDAIMDGSRGLARLAADDPEGLGLFDIVTQLPRPRMVAPSRPPAPAAELAAELFTAAEVDPLDAIGTGEWPGMPSHTCAAKEATGTAIIIRPNETCGARMFSPTWRTCAACYAIRVRRMARQTLITMATAGAMSYTLLDKPEYKRWAANVRQHRKRTGDNVHYRALPQEGGQLFVLSTHGIVGTNVPTDKRDLFDLLHRYANTPEDARASSSHGYGGNYRRLKGDGRKVKGVRLWTDARLEDVARALGTEVKKGRNTVRVQVDQHESFQKLTEAGIAMRARKGQGTALEQIAGVDVGTIAGDVTNKAQSLNSGLYALFVTDDAGGGAKAPELQPRLSEFTEGVAEWPIYLP